MIHANRVLKTMTVALALAATTVACAESQETQAESEGGEATMQEPQVTGPRVLLETSMGNILLGFYPDQAPLTVENFLSYVEDDHYDGLIFHRVMPDFMIQAGGHQADLVMRPGERPPVRNESDNGLHNLRGTVAMARTAAPHSASAQFFINLVDNPFLDFGGNPNAPDGWGYAVFGEVLEGMDVVDAIAAVPTGNAGGMQNVPREPITILSASVVEP